MPVPPLWIGGQSTAALRRAVRFGGGWLAGFQTPREFAASAARLSELSDEAGRARPGWAPACTLPSAPVPPPGYLT